jgi:acetoin utilization deacetylase AcuC-like enzyme
MTTALVYDDIYLKHETGAHCEVPSRLQTAMRALNELGILSSEKCRIEKPRMADVKNIELVHRSEYVQHIKQICLHGGGLLDGDTVLSPQSFDVALMAVGGILKACELVLSKQFKNAFALVRPPGHHAGISGRALKASTNGFCIFNNIAIAAAHLLQEKLANKILILDIDAHHGNGTQEIFNNTSKVLYVSLHQNGIFPGSGSEGEVGVGEGEGFKVNFPLPPESDDKIYMKAFDEVAMPIIEQFRPDVVLVSAGFDAHHSDYITSMALSAFGFSELIQRALNIAEKMCERKLIATLEGGYSNEALSKALPAAIAKLADIPVKIADKEPTSPQIIVNEAMKVIGNVKRIQSKYWNI